jgi:hypothetical protein
LGRSPSSLGGPTSPSRIAVCGGGSSCPVTQGFGVSGYGSSVAHYVAYVSSNSTASPPASVQATSNGVDILYDHYYGGG